MQFLKCKIGILFSLLEINAIIIILILHLSVTSVCDVRAGGHAGSRSTRAKNTFFSSMIVKVKSLRERI